MSLFLFTQTEENGALKKEKGKHSENFTLQNSLEFVAAKGKKNFAGQIPANSRHDSCTFFDERTGQ